jgi:hypothetical protein
MPAHFEGTGEDIEQAAGDIGCRRTVKSRHGENELVATQARQGIDPAHDAIQAARDLAQQFVADAVAERIVYPLEMVEVEKDDASSSLSRSAAAISWTKRSRSRRRLGRPVRYIVVGQFADALLGCLLHRDIEDGADRSRAPVDEGRRPENRCREIREPSLRIRSVSS